MRPAPSTNPAGNVTANERDYPSPGAVENRRTDTRDIVHVTLPNRSTPEILFAFTGKSAHDALATYVSAYLFATCRVPRSPFQRLPATIQLFVYAPDLRATICYGGLNMAIGTVKFFNPAKGFGFIAPEDGEKDVFVHISAVERGGMSTLSEGQRISYDVVTERGKLAADNIKAA